MFLTKKSIKVLEEEIYFLKSDIKRLQNMLNALSDDQRNGWVLMKNLGEKMGQEAFVIPAQAKKYVWKEKT